MAVPAWSRRGGKGQLPTNETAAAIGLVVLLAALGLGWLVSERVAQPLRRITADLEQVGRFNLSGEPAPISFVKEITVVNDGVDRMIGRPGG